jgi:ATP-dependent Clp protease ATP-binding subunit ClpA
MFLTTNRVDQFDDAFISRIHIILYYDKLSPDYQKKIWHQFFDKLTKDRPDFLISEEARNFILYDTSITDIGWNGREIRNGMSFPSVFLLFYYMREDPNIDLYSTQPSKQP